MSDAQTRPRVSLALQGGGAHGAFAWGVLDRLLEDGRLVIEAISGTSAGALNAAALAAGFAQDGAAGARKALERFWLSASEFAPFLPFRRTLADRLAGRWNLDRSPGYFWFNLVGRLFSPYQLNPLNHHPLRQILAQQIDIAARLRRDPAFRHRDERAHGASPCIRRQGSFARRLARLCVPAAPLPGGGNRRRPVLGRRLHGKS